jgi:hypothetical protein
LNLLASRKRVGVRISTQRPNADKIKTDNASYDINSYRWRYLVGRKEKKAQQRAAYKAAFKKVKHGHGGRPIRKKEEAALGR